MAILILKQKAQSKGAMTIRPFANSTFTESLFLLEDTMTTEIGKQNYSRKKARRFWEQTYSKLPSYVVVHHKDHNPFNNDINNLTPMILNSHTSYHASKIPNWGLKGKTLEDRIKKLESMLIIFNDH